MVHKAIQFSVAPMMEWTDRHCRYFHRRLTRRALLYTEMIATGDTVVVPASSRVFAAAGIARPDRFFADLIGRGLAGRRHAWRFAIIIGSRARDVARIAADAKATAAAIVLTTEKDAVRLAACDLGEPADRRRAARRRRSSRPTRSDWLSSCCGQPSRVRHRLEYLAVRALIVADRA